MKNRLKGPKMNKKIAGQLAGALGLLLALSLLVGIGVTPVLAVPQMPDQFWGTVTMGGSAAPAGIAITASITGAPDAATITGAGGSYNLLVPADDPDTSTKEGGVAGDTIQFYVGTTAAQTSTFAYGGITNFPLTIAAPPVPAPTVVGAATNAAGTVITITFSKNMANPVGKHGQFKYQIGGGADQNFSAAALNADNTKVDLTCAGTAIAYGNTVTVSYTKGTVLAADGGVLESFTNQAVTNNMPAPSPPVAQKLIGADDGTIVGTESANYMWGCKFTASATGTCNEVRIKVDGNCNVKVAVYANNAGEPGARLAKQDTSTACVTGWNIIPFETSFEIVNGTDYWLFENHDVKHFGYYSETRQSRYKAATYSTFTFPDPAGTGFSSYTAEGGYLAGWGTTVAPVPPAAPTRDCSVLTFRWNASAGATNYHLQVNTSADFTGTDVFNGEVGNVTSREVPGLTGNTTYYYRVKAGNAGGWSGWSSTGSMRCGGVL
jgi:hypothetical protein